MPAALSRADNRGMAAGLLPSLTRDALEPWDDLVFRALSDRSGVEAALAGVIGADPGAAVPRALAALLGWFGDPRFDARAELAAARSGRAPREWERSFVDVVARVCERGRWSALDDWRRHHDRFPADLLGFGFAAYWILTSAGADRFDEVEARVASSRRAAGDDPSLLGAQAMIDQDRGDLDRAHSLAARVLETDPGHFGGAHPMAHVFYESGQHAEGLSWLDGWLASADAGSDWFAHLSWHSALHVLGLGDDEQVVARYLACTALQGVTTVVDRTSLLWRCRLHGLVAGPADPADPPTVELVRRLLGDPPTCFLAFHAVLGLAAAGDADGLLALAAGAPTMTAPGVAELLPPLARGWAAYVAGEYAAAADLLLPTLPTLVRVGGSHAQREVVEDTVIEALLRAGRPDEAATLLRRRLDRRESVLDRRWVARAATGLSSPA